MVAQLMHGNLLSHGDMPVCLIPPIKGNIQVYVAVLRASCKKHVWLPFWQTSSVNYFKEENRITQITERIY